MLFRITTDNKIFSQKTTTAKPGEQANQISLGLHLVADGYGTGSEHTLFLMGI